MHVLVLNFDNFKSLTGNHRIYYYEGLNFYDFHFIVDSQMVKTTVMKDDIENMKRFFSDRMFYGAMRLQFNIPVPKEDSFANVTESVKIDMPILNDVPQDDELKNIDFQREGVDAKDGE